MIDTSLEHFAHIEDVVDFVKKQLPADADHEAWKNVCEDVLHCELTKVEPMLLKELEHRSEHPNEEEHVRALVRAASWYTHPQLNQEQLLAQITFLESHLATNHLDLLKMIGTAIQTPLSGSDARNAAKAIEDLIESTKTTNPDQSVITALHELRDQIYYQLLYPHWFAIVAQWKQRQPKN